MARCNLKLRVLQGTSFHSGEARVDAPGSPSGASRVLPTLATRGSTSLSRHYS